MTTRERADVIRAIAQGVTYLAIACLFAAVFSVAGWWVA